ncbi:MULTISPECIES: Gfo/Idh/MocA family protein [Vibrio]|uniref:Gfo/Idh/MocA family protein n=1 Tax=Vibrio TaxID=662 RepID=UPI0003003940|nr:MULTISPECIES: Gfo/Idh/MocA family oxidoreductase [Vibrio]OBT30047.1 oxidoreductase [Vibrio cyclitrophicus]OEE81231.1 oxidoreductase [Vibrio cyclitrophicus FF160]OEF28337.1 oxidoreductase [Vibrio cyclitrophicus 1F97]OEF43921.1 oxidoreductase [Vibrio cyclitrophicus 1F273]OEF78940.1 oxidoreductase [Vibrio cyclitrophicus 1F111]
MNDMQRKIKWGIAGLGNIANRFATSVTEHCLRGELYAVAARDHKRAATFANKFGCAKAYDSYEEMANDPAVEAVYIATVHPYHQPLAELFLKNNKHVLVEKPAFTNLADWLEMKALAKQNGVMLLEAMKTVVFPAYRELQSFLVDNNIQIDSIEASFGNHHDYDPELFIFNPELSGGATLDVGVYGLWFFYDLCRTLSVNPSKPQVEVSCLYEGANVDTDACFTFSGGMNGKISASTVQNLPRSAHLTGPDTQITIHEKWWNPAFIEIEHQGQKSTINKRVTGNGFEFEIDHFSELVLQGKTESDILNPEITFQVLDTMEKALIDSGYKHLTQPRR